MYNCVRILVILVFLSCITVFTGAQDSKSKTTSVFTLMGTVKGELTKVTDGGKRVEVRYKELVTSTRPVTNPYMTRGSTSARFRPPLQKDVFLKEKNQELDLRVMEKTIIRVLETKQLPSDQDKKKKAEAGKQDEQDDKDGEEMKNEKVEKGNAKQPEKGLKKNSEPLLPGKAGDPGSLVKGQFVIVTVYREDLPGYNRLVAGSIYILGEK